MEESDCLFDFPLEWEGSEMSISLVTQQIQTGTELQTEGGSDDEDDKELRIEQVSDGIHAERV